MSEKNTYKTRDEKARAPNSQNNKLTTQLENHNLALYNLAKALEKQMKNKYSELKHPLKSK